MFSSLPSRVWACALVIWWVCSNAFRHSDLDKLKSRLLGTQQSEEEQGRRTQTHR